MTDNGSFDVVVLGGGPGGYTAAFRAADLGLSVCLVEQDDRLGGVCLNVGCIPSKTLLHGAALIEEAMGAADFGIGFARPDIDLDRLRKKKQEIVAQLTGGLDKLTEARGITRLTGSGAFTGPNSLTVSGDGDEQSVSFASAIIATGSRPVTLPFAPDDERIWDSTDALALDFIPERLLIVGGGIIGLEMAEVYHSLGSTITIVEMEKQLIPPADKDLVQPLFLKLKKRYTIHTETRVTAITANQTAVTVSYEGAKGGEKNDFDAVLVAVGRRPNSGDLGLEHLELSLTEHGFIAVDERQRTAVPHVYAIGDVVGEPMLAHKATHQGKVAAEVIAGRKSAFTPMTIPAVAYTNPEVAWIGLTEKDAKARDIAYDKGKFAWGASGRALASAAQNGTTKALFDRKTGRLIGAGICGASGGEIIHEAVLALEMGADAEDISRTVHAHPTLSETFAFAAEIVDGSITDVLPGQKK